MTGRDRRRFERIRTAWPTIIESSDGRVGVGQIVDVSLSGMRVATDLDVEPDTPLSLRITLPRETGRLEMLVKVARRDAHGFGVAFLTEGEGEAERIAPFVAPGDIRHWARRVTVNLPVRIETGSRDGEVIQGRTVDLSTSGCRLSTDERLSVSDVVVVDLPGPDVGATLRLPALVWEAYTGGAVVVFANLARAEYLKLRDFVAHFG
ncbi:MAG TPA: PilZ domain-containing protein [Candidatus Polarisedimenticolia bacterium]|nr:PilZ domain-containing protein [Candidatus Polarisedimenticolia bacterium]